MTQTPRPNLPPDPPPPPPAIRGTLCPYCGTVSSDPRRCDSCRGFFDPLSRQATQNAMGPWFIRDEKQPFRPGCSLQTLIELIAKGKLTAETIVRGPSTRQLWTFAGRAPGISHHLGWCYACRAKASVDARSCASCGASFETGADRQHMGLAPVQLLPSQASPEAIAASVVGASTLAPSVAPPPAMPAPAMPAPRPPPLPSPTPPSIPLAPPTPHVLCEPPPPLATPRQLPAAATSQPSALPPPILPGHGRVLAALGIVAVVAVAFGLWSLAKRPTPPFATAQSTSSPAKPAPQLPAKSSSSAVAVPEPQPATAQTPPLTTQPDPVLTLLEPPPPPAQPLPEPSNPQWLKDAVGALASVPMDKSAFDRALAQATAADTDRVAALRALWDTRRAELARRALP